MPGLRDLHPEPIKRVFLSDSMGSGKTTVGKLLSRKLGSSFNDLDDLISQTARVSIPDIFQSGGEERFRKVKAALLGECIERDHVLVSMAGLC